MLFDRTPCLFPRLFPPPLSGVVSPLTCRHPKHVRCACHGQPTASPAPAAASPRATSAAPSPASPETAHTAALRRVKRYYLDLLREIIDVIRDFPDAARAVGQKLRAGAELVPDHPDFAYE